MSSAQVGAVLRHIRQLATAGKDQDLPDHQLLERFARRRDEAAFAALLRRHGPMVLGVCRSVLHDVHDAEDAFQAAFLLLAQKAGSIHRREAVSGWLYRVAYHAAVRARATAARRRVLERRAVTMPSADPVLDMSLREVRAVLLEELGGLPEKYRAPVVLCGLEEKSLDEAARLLGWSRHAVKWRLQRGRELLRACLRRRGLELPAALCVTAVALHSSPGRVSAALADATLRAAVKVAAGGGVVGGAVSAEVAALVQGASKAMFRSKVKAVILMVLAVGVAAVGFAAARPATSPADDKAQTGAAPPNAPVERPAPAAPGEEAREPVEISGRVLDPEGKPFAGAKLYLATWAPEGFKAEERVTSGEDGAFRFTMPKADFEKSSLMKWWEHTRLMAVAKGYGPDLVIFHKSAKNDGLTLRLAKDHPLSGRVLDEDGKPVVGAKVRVAGLSVYVNDEKDVDALLDAVRTAAYLGDIGTGTVGGDKYWIGPVPGQPAEATTGADGRFRLTGLGRERHVRLHIEGPGIQHGYLEAVTRPMDAVTGPKTAFVAAVRLHGATFDYAAPAARPIRGVVRDKTTGKPVAGVAVSGNTTHVARTDKDGRYELLGCPKSPTYGVTATPAPGQPYFTKNAEVADSPGLEPLTADIELPTGIPLKGCLTDGATKKPVAGATVAYYPLPPNPFATHLTYNPIVGASTAITATDGSFRLPVVAGPGVLAVKCLPGHAYMPALYTAQELRDFFKGREVRSDDRFIEVQQGANGRSVIGQEQHQALLLLDPAEKTESLEKDLTVQPGRTIKGKVVGPDGNPLKGATLNGEALPDGTFALARLNPRRTAGLYFVHHEKGLGLFKEIPADEDKPLTVQLQPCGSVTGRILDGDGQPLANVVVRIGHVEVKTGKDGRFRADGLVVGMTYRAEGVDRVRHPPFYDAVRVEPGKVTDLGDATQKD